MYKAEIGFTQVIQAMIDAKKPIIAHNPQMDILFVYEQFIGPLPDSFLEFCLEWRKLFPRIYDTRIIGKATLEQCFKKMSTDKKYQGILGFQYDSNVDSQFANYESHAQAHDAGYDAYMTGLVFATFTKKIQIDQLLAEQETAAKAEQKKKKSAQKAIAKNSASNTAAAADQDQTPAEESKSEQKAVETRLDPFTTL